LKLRHTNPALLDGDYIALNESDPNVMSYLRRYKNQAVLVVLNMSAEPQKVSFDLAPQGFASADPKTLLTTMSELKNSATLSGMTLAPFSVYIGEVRKAGTSDTGK